jgi:DNA-binding response OmpR family regulator
MAKPARVLVVDGDSSSQEKLRWLLTSFGVLVEVAGTVSKGAERAAAGRFDLILLEIRMPDRNGLELCRELYRMAWAPPVVVVSSGGMMQQDINMAIALGASLYLPKPIDTQALLTGIETLLRMRPAKRARPNGRLKSKAKARAAAG